MVNRKALGVSVFGTCDEGVIDDDDDPNEKLNSVVEGTSGTFEVVI